MGNRTTRSVALDIDGPWMPEASRAGLPPLRQSFDQNRDPLIARQLNDVHKEEAQLRRESIANDHRRSAKLPIHTNRSKDDHWQGTSEKGERDEGERGDGETGGRSSAMVSNDQPKDRLMPPPHIARSIDRAVFGDSWLKEQRDAAMAAATPDQSQDREPDHVPSRSLSGPER